MSTRVYKQEPTGKRPELDKEPVDGLKFPDLDKTRLKKFGMAKNSIVTMTFI